MRKAETFPLRKAILRSDPEVGLPSFIEDYPAFIMDNVASLCAVNSAGGWGAVMEEIEKVPVRPPFDRQWVEMKVEGAYGYDMVLNEDLVGNSAHTRVGAWVECSPSLPDSIDMEEADRLIGLHMVEGTPGAEAGFVLATVLFPIDEDGYLCERNNRQPEEADIILNPHTEARFSELGRTEQYHRLCSEAINSARTMLFGFGLANCSNGDTEKVVREVSPASRRAFKVREPEVTYYIVTLDVKGSNRASRKGDGSDGDRDLAWHLCRGHYRTYTEDAPLFGSLVGTFWIPAHTRGAREHGVRVKDYEMGALRN